MLSPNVGSAQASVSVDSVPSSPQSYFRQILVILTVAMAYHWVLAFLQTNVGFRPTTSLVGMVEVCVYAWAIGLVLTTPRSMLAIALIALVFSALFVLAIFREGYLDFKAIRDLMIPFIFFGLGAGSAIDEVRERRLFAWILGVVMVAAGVELALGSSYGRYFNTFAYHVAIGSISADSAHYSGMDVTLNAIRPEGLGSTLLSSLVGQRRISSVFIEPVSLGNFSVILAAWALSHDWSGVRRNWWALSSAAVLVMLSDSRFAMASIGAILALRLLMPLSALRLLAIASPILGVLSTVLVAVYVPTFGDNMLGRLTTSGNVFLHFPVESYFGLKAFSAHFGDMGYAYVVTRFGVPLALLLWFLVAFQVPGEDRFKRLQAMILIYISMILSISGTSVFALKTAAMTWFLVGLGFVSRRHLK